MANGMNSVPLEDATGRNSDSHQSQYQRLDYDALVGNCRQRDCHQISFSWMEVAGTRAASETFVNVRWVFGGAGGSVVHRGLPKV